MSPSRVFGIEAALSAECADEPMQKKTQADDDVSTTTKEAMLDRRPQGRENGHKYPDTSYSTDVSWRKVTVE